MIQDSPLIPLPTWLFSAEGSFGYWAKDPKAARILNASVVDDAIAFLTASGYGRLP